MDHATQCVPARGHTVLTDGLEPLQNRAMTTAVIDKVAFSDPKGLRVIRAYVVPTPGRCMESYTAIRPRALPASP